LSWDGRPDEVERFFALTLPPDPVAKDVLLVLEDRYLRASFRPAWDRGGGERISVHFERGKQASEPLELLLEPSGKATQSLLRPWQ
jgi:hypothetical protein